ncbi:hypothetical protein TCAL_16191, partial [Tigriopus californicus]
MKAFIAILSALALATADQSSHQTIKHGNAPAVHSSIHKPHGRAHARVVSQPSAQPNEVNQAYNEEKYTAAAHAPSHEAFVAVLSVLALAAADQSSHQTIKHGNAPAVHSSIHKPHGGSHAHVVSQPSAQPNEVNQAYNEEKYTAAAHAPSHEVRTPAYHPAPHHAPVHHAPAYHAAPVHHAPAYHAAPVHHAPAPYHPSPVHHAAPAFVAVLSVLALAAADQSSHQTIKHGNAPAVHSSIHKPHGGSHAHVVSQPSAQPNEVNQAYNEEKYTAAAHAPSHEVRTPAYHPAPHHAPVHHAPAYHAAPVHHAPAYHAAPVHHAPAPYHPSPVHHAAPVHHAPAPYHPAPAHGHAHGDEYEAAPVYQYGYAVADDYSGSNFAQNENRDNYATNGEYRVALPDGRTQIVSYSVADAYSGYVADVR